MVTPGCQDSDVLVVAPGFERLVLLRTARLAASLARHAATAVAAIGVYQLVGQPAAVFGCGGYPLCVLFGHGVYPLRVLLAFVRS
jgi:hypothetical protein